MSDPALVMDRLGNVLEALEKILRRFSNVHSVDDFVLSEAGMERLDGICMLLIAIGEAFKQIAEVLAEISWYAILKSIGPGSRGSGMLSPMRISTLTRNKFSASAGPIFRPCETL
ncbi:MAG: hypothetical protein PF482_15640 [Desulfobacteraceae bacterium]|jgi:hypothetical protein|nr:hypothetical protein [Desulfobacteraceae bacterium]